MPEWHCRPAGCMEPSMMLEAFLCLNVGGLGQDLLSTCAASSTMCRAVVEPLMPE